MGQIKAVFRDVKTEHLEKLFGGKIIAVHEIDCITAVETDAQVFMLTGGEAALLRALTDLDVQRTGDLACVISKYEDALKGRGEYTAALQNEIGVLGKKLELEISSNEAQRAAINEMRAELKGLTHELKTAKQDLGIARQKLVAKKPGHKRPRVVGVAKVGKK